MRSTRHQAATSISMLLLLVLSSFAGTDLLLGSVVMNSDQDGDGLSYGLEYLIGTQPNDWDSDNDNLPDGWEWARMVWTPRPLLARTGPLATPTGTGSRISRVQLRSSRGVGQCWYDDPPGQWCLVERDGACPALERGGRHAIRPTRMRRCRVGMGAVPSSCVMRTRWATYARTGSTTTEMVRSTVLIRITTVMLIVRATTMMGMVSRMRTSTVGTPMVTGCLTGGKRPTVSTQRVPPVRMGPTETPMGTG